MALIKCPECGHTVSDQAVSCPNCGFQIAGKSLKCEKLDESQTIATPDRQEKPPQKKNIGCGIVLGIFAVLVIIIIIAALSPGGDSNEIKVMAYATTYIHEIYYSDVKLSKKDAVITADGNEYTVKGKFSLNGIVHRYTIIMRLNADSASIISCNIS